MEVRFVGRSDDPLEAIAGADVDHAARAADTGDRST